MQRVLGAACAGLIAFATLGGAASAPVTPFTDADATTVIETTATAAVDFPPDRLLIALDVEAEAGAPAPVDLKTVDLAVARLTAAGIPAAAVLKRYVTTPAERWKRLATDLDPRPYGVVLLQFPKPSRSALVTLTEQTLPKAFSEPLSDSAFAEVGGAWYGLDDCKRLRVAARKGALALARDRGEQLARTAGFTLDASGIRPAAAEDVGASDAQEAGQTYLCGPSSLPDVPPPQLHTATTSSERNGFVEEESTMTVDWPTLPLALPQPLTVAKNRTSLGSGADDEDGPELAQAPGMLRSIVAVSSADTAGSAGCSFNRALAAALGLALQRAAAAGRIVGLVPDRPLTIVDQTVYRARCPARGPSDSPETARIVETFAAGGPRGARGTAHLEARGDAQVKLAADRARVVASVGAGPGTSAADATARLAAAGLDRTTLHVSGTATLAIDGYVTHPTAATMTAIDAALASLAAPPAAVPAPTPAVTASPAAAATAGTSGTSGPAVARTFAYAVDDCAALEDRVLRLAVAAAQAAGHSEAAKRGVRLRAVSSLETGAFHIRNCGPHVLEKLPLTPHGSPDEPAGSTDPSVIADGSVRLLYAL